MQQSEGFSVKGKEKLECKLKKSLYSLKQAPRQWYKKFDGFMKRHGYNKCNADHCYYFKRFKSSFIILLLYVDNMLVAGSDFKEISKLKKQLSNEFEMKDLGAVKQILAMRISKDKQKGTLQLSQAKYIERVLKRFNMNNAKAVSTPLANHFRLSQDQCSKTEDEKNFMAKIPYASAIESLIGSSKQVHEGSRQTTLGSSKVDIEISMGDERGKVHI
ncbi:retrovirus-related Pol polyprotein from transposon TNT 1-94 [Cornus florida]|uniref:retrovirus-related Pol polyprotein from transposon TNT 1-94 n=1 Tax=Cornus florida TaxID=4283 RepID=UPI00289EC050|nr:retrovirus-related Pol polyprotein from transposon TNT 1-94 [Cornus florida]